MNVKILMDSYITSLDNKSTQKSYRIALNEFFSNYSLEEITYEVLENYKKTLSEEKASQTVNARLTAIKGFFQYCYEEGYIGSNPAEYLEIEKVERYSNSKNITIEDFKLLLSQINLKSLVGIRDMLLLRLLYFLGDLHNTTKIGFGYINSIPDHLQPLLSVYVGKLEEKLDPESLDDGFLFFSLDKLTNLVPLSESSVRKVINKYTAKAGLSKNSIDVQALKRLRAKQIYEKTASVEAVQKFCGHKNIKTTKEFLRSFES